MRIIFLNFEDEHKIKAHRLNILCFLRQSFLLVLVYLTHWEFSKILTHCVTQEPDLCDQTFNSDHIHKHYQEYLVSLSQMFFWNKR